MYKCEKICSGTYLYALSWWIRIYTLRNFFWLVIQYVFIRNFFIFLGNVFVGTQIFRPSPHMLASHKKHSLQKSKSKFIIPLLTKYITSVRNVDNQI